MSRLGKLQQRFVDEFVADDKLCAKDAAIRAGYSPKTAEVQASRLLSSVKIQQAISVARQARSERTQITQDVVLRRIDALSRASLGEVATWKDNKLSITDWDDLTPDQRYMIESITTKPTEFGTQLQIKVRKVDDALKLLALHTGLTEPKAGDGVHDDLKAANAELDALEQEREPDRNPAKPENSKKTGAPKATKVRRARGANHPTQLQNQEQSDSLPRKGSGVSDESEDV